MWGCLPWSQAAFDGWASARGISIERIRGGFAKARASLAAERRRRTGRWTPDRPPRQGERPPIELHAELSELTTTRRRVRWTRQRLIHGLTKAYLLTDPSHSLTQRRQRQLASRHADIPGPARVQRYADKHDTTAKALRKEAATLASKLKHDPDPFASLAQLATTMTPPELAEALGISTDTLRAWLRTTYPRSLEQAFTTWELTADQIEAARQWRAALPRQRAAGGRKVRDADYVLDLCDEILGEHSSREHTFPWLRGDPKPSTGKRNRLPVDAYYPEHQLVIEYRERKHDQPVPFFDKPGRKTISGVGRQEQRRRYDERRDTLIPQHGLRLLIIKPADLDADSRGRLRRNEDEDRPVLRTMLKPF
ncbi:MAG: hypothetical protein IRZ21_03145 [Thermoleophilaceae bacterium]|nr:hypothetical protein [Thermoleophilaceae bacterium]